MCYELYQIKRMLISLENELLTKEQVIEKISSGELSETSYGKNMINWVYSEEPKSLVEWSVRELDRTCVHSWVEDEIEMPDESIQKIKYCCHCENNFKK